jgi:hypothetical protein
MLLISAFVATACGGASSNNASSSDAEGTLLAALVKMQGGPSTVTISLHSDPQTLRTVSSGGGHQLSSKEAHTILSSSISVSHTGGSDPQTVRSQMSVTLGGRAGAIETRKIGDTLYARVDAAALAQLMGKNPTDLAKLQKQAIARGFDFVKPALQGRWLSLKGLNRSASSPLSGQNPQQGQASSAFLRRLLNAATVTTVGTDSAGTHLAVKAPAREVYASLQDAFGRLAGGVPPGAALPDPSTVPNRDVRVDAWVKDGSLSQVELDLLQFAALSGKPVPSGAGTLALRMTFRDFTGSIRAPAGAVPVDLKGLARGFMGNLSEGSGAAAAL